MNKLFKAISLSLLVTAPVCASEVTVFEQQLGGEFNYALEHEDFSDDFVSGDGTLTYAYKPSKQMIIPFKNYVAYLTPISKKVAIVEASKIDDSIALCRASSRHFATEFADKVFESFLTVEQLSDKGYEVSSLEGLSGVQVRIDPDKNHTLQFGCVSSSAEEGKFAFIVSFSDGNLKSVASQERDKIVATQK